MNGEGSKKGKTMDIEDTEIDDTIETPEEKPENQEAAADTQAPVEPSDDDDIIIEIDGEEPDGREDTPAIRQLREANRQQARELAELRAKHSPGTVEVGAKPTLESCDYDEERFETELTAWHGRKVEADRAQEAQAEQERKNVEHWNGIEAKYRSGAAALKVPGFEAKEQKVVQALPEIVIRAVKQYALEPAKVIAALGANDALLDRLAKEGDAFQQIVNIVRLEGKMKVTRTRQIEPDKPLSGSASLEVGDDAKKLEKLEKEAARTGDRTALIAFKAKMRQKAA